MSASRAPSATFEVLLAVSLFVVVSLVSAFGQQAARIDGDAKAYHTMSMQYLHGKSHVSGEAPFVYRIGTPWLAGIIGPPLARVTPYWLRYIINFNSGLDDVPPFYAVNIAASFVSVFLLLAYLKCFIESPGIRLLLVAAWCTHWLSPVRIVYFNPVLVDPLFQAMALAGLLAIEKLRNRGDWVAAAAVAALTFAGTLCRESMLLVPVAFAVSRQPVRLLSQRRWMSLAATGAPSLAWLAALYMTRVAATATNDYQTATAFAATVKAKPIFSWFLAWFFTFGPWSIALIAASTTSIREFARRRPELVVWLAGCAVLAFVAGTDTERILAWATPVVLVLTGLAICETLAVLRATPWLVGLLGIAWLASSRVLWTIPVRDTTSVEFATLGLNWNSIVAVLDKLLVITNYYSNLWTFFGSRTIHAVLLVGDLAFVAVVVLLVRRRRYLSAANSLSDLLPPSPPAVELAGR